MRQFNSEDQKEICRLYDKEGLTIINLAKRYHCRKEAIGNVLNINNIPRKGHASVNRLLNHEYFDTIDCEEKAYFLGLLFTDGSVVLDNDKSKNRAPQISLQLKVSDEDLVKAFREAVNSNAKLSYDKREKKECVQFRFRSQHMADSLAKYGIVSNKTYKTKHLPKVPDEYLKDFIRGCIDGDGSIYKNNQGRWAIDFCSCHQSVCEDFRDYCKKLGFDNTNLIANYGTAYHIRYYKKDVVAGLATLLYKDSKVSLTRKYLLAAKIYNEYNNEEDIVYSDQ